MSNSLTWKILIGKTLLTSRFTIHSFPLLAMAIRTQYYSNRLDSSNDWTLNFPYKDSIFEIYDDAVYGNSTHKSYMVTLIDSPVTVLLKLDRHISIDDIVFWNDFSNQLQVICDSMLVATIQSA